MSVINLRDIEDKKITPISRGIITFRLPRPMSNQHRKVLKSVVKTEISVDAINDKEDTFGGQTLITLDGYISLWVASIYREHKQPYSFAIHKGFDINKLPIEIQQKTKYYMNKAECIIQIDPTIEGAISITEELYKLYKNVTDVKNKRWFNRNLFEHYNKYLPVLYRNMRLITTEHLTIRQFYPKTAGIRNPATQLALNLSNINYYRGIPLDLQDKYIKEKQFKKQEEDDEIPF